MEVSLLGSSLQLNIIGRRFNLGNKETDGLCSFSRNLSFTQLNSFKNSKICTRNNRNAFSLKLSAPLLLKASAFAQNEAALSANTKSKPARNSSRLYVGLPLDVVSDTKVNHARAIAAGLKALKLSGVEGVELPVFWGIAEKEAMGKYNWTSYLALAELVQKMGLKLHLSLYFHACNQHHIPLPKWVSRIGESQPDIFFTDRSGQRYKDCLALSSDDLPILDGKTPLEVYKNFFEQFNTAFAPFFSSTITGISVGLGPNGELQYPSYHHPPKHGHHTGAGEFQCYDKHMLSHLKQHAEAHGHRLWGLAGPHDAPKYDEAPLSNSSFFKENGGTWESAYGDFFLSWYSNQLISHGDRLLSLAVSTFSDYPVAIYGQVPLISSWYQTRSHPAELTAGYYNTVCRDGYEAVMEMFSRNSCKIILPGMDLSNTHQPNESLSSPESLLQHITSTSKKHGVEICGQNYMASGGGARGGLKKIKKNLLHGDSTSLFIYHRMGAFFFSPEHFPSFTQFVRSLSQPQLYPDDLPVKETDSDESLSGEAFHMEST